MNSNEFLEKKLYLINSLNDDIQDLTIAAFEMLNNVECIILNSKIKKSFAKQIKKINPVIFYESKFIKKKEPRKLHEKIFNLFDKFNSIIHFQDFDNFFSLRLSEEYLFFKKKRVSVFFLPEVNRIFETLNTLNLPITDRRKNSSVNFLEAENLKEIKFNFKNKNFEKLIFKVNDLGEFDKIILKINKFEKTYLFSYISSNAVVLKRNDLTFRSQLEILFKKNMNVYILVEKIEKI